MYESIDISAAAIALMDDSDIKTWKGKTGPVAKAARWDGASARRTRRSVGLLIIALAAAGYAAYQLIT